MALFHPLCPSLFHGLNALGAFVVIPVMVIPPAVAVTPRITIFVQYILNTLEGGFAAFLAGPRSGPAFAFTPRALAGAALETLAHFVELLGLLFGEDGAHFLLVFLAQRTKFLADTFAITAFAGFGHELAKSGALLGLQLFHLLGLFFIETEGFGEGCTAIGAWGAFAAEFWASLAGATFFFVCLHGTGQQTGREENNGGFAYFHLVLWYIVPIRGENRSENLSVAARDADDFDWLHYFSLKSVDKAIDRAFVPVTFIAPLTRFQR